MAIAQMFPWLSVETNCQEKEARLSPAKLTDLHKRFTPPTIHNRPCPPCLHTLSSYLKTNRTYSVVIK